MKNTYKIINILIFLLIVTTITIFLKSDIYEFDDYYQSFFYTYNLKSLIMNADQGRYISWFVMKIVCHCTSVFLNIHPNENIIPKIVTGIDFAILSYMYAKLSSISSKTNKLNPVLYLSAFFVSMSLVVLHFDYLDRWNQHFDYILMFIVFLWFVSVVANYFLNDALPDRKDCVRNCVLFFIMGISTYFNIFMAFFVLLFLALYYKDKFNIKNLITNKKYRSILIPVILGLAGSVMVFANRSLSMIFNIRTPKHFLPDQIVSFTQAWLHSMILNPAILIINLTIIILMITVYLMNKKITKPMMLSFVIIFAGLLFEYLLIFSGKTYVHRYYWVSFSRVYLIHYFYCLIPIFLLTGEIIKSKTSLLIPLIVSSIIFSTTIPKYIQKYQSFKPIRRELYMIIKSEQFFITHNFSDAPAPKKYLDWDRYTFRKGGRPNWCMKGFYLNYKLIYNHKALPLKFMSEEEFLKKAADKGLNFSEEELKQPNFNNFNKH